MTLKELLIYDDNDLYKRYVGNNTQIKLIKQKTISQNIKDFMTADLYNQRKTLILLLTKQNDPEYQYLAYLLYDLLSNETNGSVDTQEQKNLYNSLPWNIKKYFKNAMKTTIKYTKNLTNFDTSKIPLEQQICLMKVPDNVKEKAMIKLKEVKAKSEDTGSKARQYLDGLLKIPFGIFKKEDILCKIQDMNENYKNILTSLTSMIKKDECKLEKKTIYNSNEIFQNIQYIENTYFPSLQKEKIETIINILTNCNRNQLIKNICYLNDILKKLNIIKK